MKAISRFVVTSRQTKMGLDNQRGEFSELKEASEKSQCVAKEN